MKANKTSVTNNRQKNKGRSEKHLFAFGEGLKE